MFSCVCCCWAEQSRLVFFSKVATCILNHLKKSTPSRDLRFLFFAVSQVPLTLWPLAHLWTLLFFSLSVFPVSYILQNVNQLTQSHLGAHAHAHLNLRRLCRLRRRRRFPFQKGVQCRRRRRRCLGRWRSQMKSYLTLTLHVVYSGMNVRYSGITCTNRQPIHDSGMHVRYSGITCTDRQPIHAVACMHVRYSDMHARARAWLLQRNH
jgi:hypothetical protein